MPSNQTNHVQKTCTMCGETKPISEYKRKLSKRQSLALLKRTSINTPLTVISSRCKTCWTVTKRRTPLSIKDIQNKIASGDIKRVAGEILIKQKRTTLNARRSRVMKEYWQGIKDKHIKDLNTALQQQVAQYKSRYNTYRNYTKRIEATPQQHALLRQHSLAYEQAKNIKKDLMVRAKAGEQIAPDIKIVTLLKPQHNEKE